MWHGVGEYLLFATLVGLAVHAVSGRYTACTFVGAACCAVGNLVHEAWLVNWQVNIGWGPPMFVVGVLLALPVCALAGLPWLATRRLRRRPTKRCR
jgi:hypothetical protein